MVKLANIALKQIDDNKYDIMLKSLVLAKIIKIGIFCGKKNVIKSV